MVILLDPSRDGCHVYFLNRKSLKYIHGDVCEVCDKIFKFCTNTYKNNKDETITEQVVTILLDSIGIGAPYYDCLVFHYGLNVDCLTLEKQISL